MCYNWYLLLDFLPVIFNATFLSNANGIYDAWKSVIRRRSEITRRKYHVSKKKKHKKNRNLCPYYYKLLLLLLWNICLIFFIRLLVYKSLRVRTLSVLTRADKGWAVKRALRSSFNVWCGVGLARALFPPFRCASRPAKFSFLQTGNPVFFL